AESGATKVEHGVQIRHHGVDGNGDEGDGRKAFGGHGDRLRFVEVPFEAHGTAGIGELHFWVFGAADHGGAADRTTGDVVQHGDAELVVEGVPAQSAAEVGFGVAIDEGVEDIDLDLVRGRDADRLGPRGPLRCRAAELGLADALEVFAGLEIDEHLGVFVPVRLGPVERHFGAAARGPAGRVDVERIVDVALGQLRAGRAIGPVLRYHIDRPRLPFWHRHLNAAGVDGHDVVSGDAGVAEPHPRVATEAVAADEHGLAAGERTVVRADREHGVGCCIGQVVHVVVPGTGVEIYRVGRTGIVVGLALVRPIRTRQTGPK